MKKLLFLSLSLITYHSSLAAVGCNCGIAPERQNDFFWENEIFGMRAYGPGEYHRWSGLDIFNKNAAEGGTVAELLHYHDYCGNWHETPWKGVLDNYAVGAGRGVGGVALYGDGEWKTYPNWESCKVIKNTPDMVEFELVYPAFCMQGKMTYHITLKKGAHFFKNTVTFERNKLRNDFLVGPGFDIAESRGHAGSLVKDEALGLVSLYEDDKGPVLGATMSAVILDPKDAEGVEFKTDHLGCLVLATKRASFTYYAGVNWSKNGTVKSAEEWHELVKNFRKELDK